MSSLAGPGQVYRAGDFLFDSVKRCASNGRGSIHLNWRTFEALRLLIEARGEVVAKETLFASLWPGVTVEESSLTKCIAQLRKTLGEAGCGEDWIETVPRLGYRLTIVLTVESTGEPARAARRSLWVWTAAAAVVVAAAGFAFWQYGRGQQKRAEAERLYAEGQRLRRMGDPSSIQGSIVNFRDAIAHDPNRAEYFSALAEALGRTGAATGDATDRTLMREAAERAVALDPHCEVCQINLGLTLFTRFWEWRKSEEHLRAAMKLSSDGMGPSGYLAMFMATQGRLDEAVGHAEAAIRKDPYQASLYEIQALVLHFARRFPDAIAAADRGLGINPQNRGCWDWRGHALHALGRDREAAAALARAAKPDEAVELDSLFARAGFPAVLHRILDGTGGSHRQWYRRAQLYVYLGDPAAALSELETAFHARHFNMMYAAADPAFESLRGEPRFQKILDEMHLPKPAPVHAAGPQPVAATPAR